MIIQEIDLLKWVKRVGRPAIWIVSMIRLLLFIPVLLMLLGRPDDPLDRYDRPASLQQLKAVTGLPPVLAVSDIKRSDRHPNLDGFDLVPSSFLSLDLLIPGIWRQIGRLAWLPLNEQWRPRPREPPARL